MIVASLMEKENIFGKMVMFMMEILIMDQDRAKGLYSN